MKQLISEDRAIYEDMYHGQFSKKLAEWAIKKMKGEEGQPIQARPLDRVTDTLMAMGVELPEKTKYTAWYLFNMAIADYPRSLKTDEQRAHFVEETLCDPDGCPANVLDCFVTKMCNAGEPIYWEDFV